MSTILDHLEELRGGDIVAADCPTCSRPNTWWRPRPDDLTSNVGIKCMGCDYTIGSDFDAKPPAILCSSCGLALEQHDHGFRCAPCDREVRP